MYREFKKLLISKLDILEQIYNNTIKQSKVLKKRNEKLLLTLIGKRQKMIDKVDKINGILIQFDEHIYNEDEIKKIKQRIQLKLKEIEAVNEANHLEGKKYIEEIKESVRKVKEGKKATLNGYLKMPKLTHGYYIDKKIGT